MRELNLKHLHYFWVVAREGSITRASERLFVTPQTISAQIRELEQRLQCELFERQGRNLRLTAAGSTALQYADTIFDLSKELAAVLVEGGAEVRQMRVGIVDVVPKSISALVMKPLLEADPAPRLLCREGKLSDLVARMAQQGLDCVISDLPAPLGANLRLYTQELGSSPVSFFAAEGVAPAAHKAFPDNLNGSRFLLPRRHTALRTALENWLREKGVTYQLAGECDDSALIKALGQAGAGVFIAPTAAEAEVVHQYGVEVLGRTEDLQAQFFLITTTPISDRPLLSAIVSNAHEHLFAHTDV
jgi:LysR family transcriptional activator of nhaA